MKMKDANRKAMFARLKKNTKGRSGMFQIGVYRGVLGATNDLKTREIAEKELQKLQIKYGGKQNDKT